MLLLAITTSAIAFGYVFYAIAQLKRQKRPSGNVYRIFQSEPIVETGCSGCLFIPCLIGLTAGFSTSNSTIIVIFASATAVCVVPMFSSALMAWRRKRFESKFHERIELTDDSILYFDKFGELKYEVKNEDIDFVARYQGLTDDRTPFDDCVIHLKSGEELVLTQRIECRKNLIKKIERRTGLEFQYRKNSSRNPS